MKITKYLVVFFFTITLLIQFGCDKDDNSIIISEILAKYNSLNGVVDDAKVDLH
jgi:preprotein translocase subunit SecG